jgi:uncharacterized MnhB-related membrane protein
VGPFSTLGITKAQHETALVAHSPYPRVVAGVAGLLLVVLTELLHSRTIMIVKAVFGSVIGFLLLAMLVLGLLTFKEDDSVWGLFI